MKLQIAVSRASLIFQKRFPDAVSITEADLRVPFLQQLKFVVYCIGVLS